MNKYSLAFMSFLCVVNFSGIINGFVFFHGIDACIPWLAILVLYFLPYTLMVAELATCFKDTDGGLTIWINKTINKKIGFFCGWFYLVLEVVYLSQRSNNIVLAINWALFQNGDVSNYSIFFVQGLGLVLILLAAFCALHGPGVFEKGSSLAGSLTFFMLFLFIVAGLVLFSPMAESTSLNLFDSDVHSNPFTLDIFFNLSLLIVSIGGSEKLATYVNRMKNPSRDFSKSMIIFVILVSVCVLLGTVVLSFVFDINNLPLDILANGQYYCFQNLGNSLGLGNILVVCYAVLQLVGIFFITVISLDSPVRMFMANADSKYFPSILLKKNKHGVYKNMLWLNVLIIAIIVILPCAGSGNINDVVAWFVKLAGASLPLGFVFVFIAYIALKVKSDKFKSAYVFIKNKKLGIAVGVFCAGVTLVFSIIGLIEETPLLTLINYCILGLLIASAFIIPMLAKISKNKMKK